MFIFPEVHGVEQVEVPSLEEGALGVLPDFRDLVDGFLGDDEMAGDDEGHGVASNGVGHGPDSGGIVAEGREITVTVQFARRGIFPFVMVQGEKFFPDLFLEGRPEQVKVFPGGVLCKGGEVGSAYFFS